MTPLIVPGGRSSRRFGNGAGAASAPPPSGDAWYEQQWDYASTAALQADMSFVNESGGTVTLLTSAGAGAQTTSGNAMRATFTTSGEGTVGVDILPSDYATEQAREVWIEVYKRFTGWNIGSDDKTFFYLEDQSGVETARWELHIVSATYWYGGPSGSGAFGVWNSEFPGGNGNQEGAALTALWDGQWHRLRMHQRMSTNPTTSDGRYRVWWDDRLLIDWQNIDTNSPSNAFFRNMALRRNADPGAGATCDWGRLRVYTTDPGWT